MIIELKKLYLMLKNVWIVIRYLIILVIAIIVITNKKLKGYNMKKIYVSLTGYDFKNYESKFKELKKFNISEVCLFLTALPHKHHKYVFEKLLHSNIKYIPLVHISHETTKSEIEFLKKNFKTKYFNIHAKNLNDLDKYIPYTKNILLETHPEVEFNETLFLKTGGFCIDVAHF